MPLIHAAHVGSTARIDDSYERSYILTRVTRYRSRMEVSAYVGVGDRAGMIALRRHYLR